MTVLAKVPLSKLITPVARPETPIPGRLYRQIGVKLWGEGAYERESIDGAETKYSQLFAAAKDDIIVNKIWARNGSVAVVPAALEGCYGSGEFPMFSQDRTMLHPRWMHWLTKTRVFWAQCDDKSRGTSGKNRIRPERFLEIEIPLPPLPEQERIVTKIDRIEVDICEALKLREQVTTETSSIPLSQTSSIFEELCERFPKRSIRTLGLGGANPVQTGPFGAQLHSSDFAENGVPVLNVGNVWPEGLRLNRLDHVLPEKADQLIRYSLKSGDLLFARSGATLGKVCLVPPECDGWLMTGHLFRVRFDQSQILNRFAFAALRGARSIHEQVFGQVRGATRPGYNTTLLGNIELPLPSLAEQRRIVDELDSLQSRIDTLKRLQAETAAELGALLPSVLSKAFAGELCGPIIGSDE